MPPFAAHGCDLRTGVWTDGAVQQFDKGGAGFFIAGINNAGQVLLVENTAARNGFLFEDGQLTRITDRGAGPTEDGWLVGLLQASIPTLWIDQQPLPLQDLVVDPLAGIRRPEAISDNSRFIVVQGFDLHWYLLERVGAQP